MLFVWMGFLVFVVAVVLLDLGVFHRTSREINLSEALTWTAVWVVLALLFNLFLYSLYEGNWLGWQDGAALPLTGRQAATQFLTGYLVEKSLSVDNLFVIAMIFSYFRVPLAEQHRVLFWGILGAVVMRGVMIAAGITLIARFDWVIYVFGILLIISAVKMLIVRHDTIHPERNLVVRWAQKAYPFAHDYDGSRFFTRIDGRRAGTPLLLALILVESSDVMFAVDSIPAILAITRDPFLVFTSNVFAILGLRSLYFALAGMMDRFRYLKMSLVFLLAYVGVKMLLSHHYPIPNVVSLAIIAVILAVGVAASLIAGREDPAALLSPLADELEELISVSYRQARRMVVLLVGMTVLLIGVIMIILPGPATLVIPLGLMILAAEFAWARLWLKRLRNTMRDIRDKAEQTIRSWKGNSKT